MTHILVKESVDGRDVRFWTDALFASADQLTNGMASSSIYGYQWNPKLDATEAHPFTVGGDKVAWGTPVTRANAFFSYPEELPHSHPRTTSIFNIFPISDTQLVLFGYQHRQAVSGDTIHFYKEQANGFWVVTLATDGTITVSEPYTMWYRVDTSTWDGISAFVPSGSVSGGTLWAPGPWLLAGPGVLRILDMPERGDLLLNVAATGVTIASQPKRHGGDTYFGDVFDTGHEDVTSFTDVPGFSSFSNPFVTRRSDQCWYVRRNAYKDPTGPKVVKVDPDGTRTPVLITQDDPTMTFSVTNLAMIGPKQIAVSGYRYPKTVVTTSLDLSTVMQWCVYDVDYTKAIDTAHATSIYHPLTPLGAPKHGAGFWGYQVVDMPDDDFVGTVVVRRQGYFTGSGSPNEPNQVVTEATGNYDLYDVSVWNYPDLDTSYSDWVRVAVVNNGLDS